MLTLKQVKEMVEDVETCEEWEAFIKKCRSLKQLREKVWESKEAREWLADHVTCHFFSVLAENGMLEWDKFDGSNWATILGHRPGFADYCDWSQLDSDDWEGLVAWQPQFKKFRPWPDGTYLHVEEMRSGQTWIVPLKPSHSLNIKTRIKDWVKKEFGGELRLGGEPMPRLQGDYYAKIITDGRPPDSVVVWDSGGFYLTHL